MNEYPLTVSRESFLCVDIPVLMDKAMAHWKSKSKDQQQTRIRVIEKNLKAQHCCYRGVQASAL